MPLPAVDRLANLFWGRQNEETSKEQSLVDVYFSADVETDGPIPGIYSMLSFALVYAGTFDGRVFNRPPHYQVSLYKELKPISSHFDPAAMRVNRLDRNRLTVFGESPDIAMSQATRWVREVAGIGRPVLVAYPLSFDWSWLYWYFTRFSSYASPFNHSSCFDIKTAFALKAHTPIAAAGRSNLLNSLRPPENHSHHALEDAVEQAAVFANIFEWEGVRGRTP